MNLEIFTQHIVSVAALAQVYTVICRAVKMDRSTKPSIRHSMAAQATTAMALALLPWSNPGTFEICVLAYLAATVWVQVATSRLWRVGVPDQFKEKHNGH